MANDQLSLFGAAAPPDPTMWEELSQRVSGADRLAKECFDWAEATFPHRTDQSMFLKLYGEVAEMIGTDDPELEIADVLILVLDYAVRKQINVTRAVQRKLAINRSRTWEIAPNGVMQHVKGT